MSPLSSSTPPKKRQKTTNVQQPQQRRIQIIIPPEIKFEIYRNSLKNNGYAELSIPKELKEQISHVDYIVNSLEAKIPTKMNSVKPGFFTIKDYYQYQLAPKMLRHILKSENDLSNHIQDSLKNIFQNHTIETIRPLQFCIRDNIINNDMFHKDEKELGTVSVVIPYRSGQGTAYIPIEHKEKYPDKRTIKGRNDTDSLELFKWNSVNNDHIRYADSEKIFIFLNRKPEIELGEDYANKSLVHAIPDQTGTTPRFFLLARYKITKNELPQDDSKPPARLK